MNNKHKISVLFQRIFYAVCHPLVAISELLSYPIGYIFKRIHMKYLFSKADFFNIPIYIISYNRLTYLKQMLSWLENYGYKNIVIIDNHSDYEPLLSFYETCPYKVIRMEKNYGHTVFYKAPCFFWKRLFSFYIITDPDLSPVENCPGNFVEVFMRIMFKYPNFYKVGFSLKIDDISDEYYLKNEVIAWEKQFYRKLISSSPYIIYKANIDTTFALTAPSLYKLAQSRLKAIRTGEPYQLRHLPWYVTERDAEGNNYITTMRQDVGTWNGNRTQEDISSWINKY